MSNALAASAVSAMIYVGAVEDPLLNPGDQRYARPSTILMMQDEVLAKADPGEREAWYRAAIGQTAKDRVRALVNSWGIPYAAWYADNTRETLRDETFHKWREQGAAIDKPGLAITSSKPRWALAHEFAALFRPDLVGDALTAAIGRWIDTYMTPAGRLRTLGVRQQARVQHAVDVALPTGERRRLAPGLASQILKGVIEQWAPTRLRSPIVLTISEPGDKVYLADEQNLRLVGLAIDVSKLLPDALLADFGSEPLEFWFVEAVATDGEIDEDRKALLLDWASQQGIPETSCRFLTAFASRHAAPARRRLKDIAAGTFAWFLDEPSGELAWYEIPTVQGQLAGVTPITRVSN